MEPDTTRRDLVVIGASAGGVEALRAMVADLPADLPASVLVVLHIPPTVTSVLPAILDRSGPLPVRHAVDGERLEPGVILVATPDRHLLVDDDRIRLSRGPRENGHRPAIDVLFRSAARSAGIRVVGIVLSGVLDDGTAGLAAVAARGGLTVAQDPSEALYPAMPLSALDQVRVDHVVRAADIGDLLAKVCAEPIAHESVHAADTASALAMVRDAEMNQQDEPGKPSGFSCPDCNGVLFEIDDDELVRYRCRVGHAWSPESLAVEQAQQLDTAMWMALRSLEEKAALARTMAERAEERNNPATAARYALQADEAAHAAGLIRSLLETQLGSRQEPKP